MIGEAGSERNNEFVYVGAEVSALDNHFVEGLSLWQSESDPLAGSIDLGSPAEWRELEAVDGVVGVAGVEQRTVLEQDRGD